MGTASPLSERQIEILDCIARAVRSQGYPPTVREICRHVGVSSTTSVHRHLHTLQERGYLRADPRAKRSLQLTDRAADVVGEGRVAAKSPAGRARAAAKLDRSRGLVVVGQIAAGVPIDAIENPERFDLADTFDPDRHFLLRVKGDSMIDDHIADGDLVVIRKQETCHNGDVVAAVVDGEATLKRFHRRKDHILLQPANSRLQPLRVKSVEIRGVMVGVIRQVH